MADQRSARSHSPLVAALRLALKEIAERKAAEKAERRARLSVVDGRRRDAA